MVSTFLKNLISQDPHLLSTVMNVDIQKAHSLKHFIQTSAETQQPMYR